jgi:hypothetical protein
MNEYVFILVLFEIAGNRASFQAKAIAFSGTLPVHPHGVLDVLRRLQRASNLSLYLVLALSGGG